MKQMNEPARAAGSESAPRGAASRPASASFSAEDDEILSLVASGDLRAALVAVMRTYGDIVYGHCVRLLRDPVLAQDVYQQVFLEAFRDLPKFRAESSVRTWLFGIASHRCLDAIKSARRRERRIGGAIDKEIVTMLPDPSPHLEERLDQARLSQALQECLQRLSEEARLAVLMRFHARMSYEEMAGAVGEKAGTLQARVARALPLLRRCLGGKGVRP